MLSNLSPIYKQRILVAFDFDHTLVELNTDLVIRDKVKDKIPSDIQELHRDTDWICYMQEVFKIVHANNITKSDIKEIIQRIPSVIGLKTILKQLHDIDTVDILIISDSNSVFINYWLERHNLTHCVKKIFTNPAHFDENGLLIVEPYHFQTKCKLSSENLCKGDILESYVENELKNENVIYSRIFYVGDGTNDVCPVLRLGVNDFALARDRFKLHEQIKKTRAINPNFVLDPAFFVWNGGFELRAAIFDNLNYE